LRLFPIAYFICLDHFYDIDVPLLQRSLELWQELQEFYQTEMFSKESGNLLELCGGIMIGKPDTSLIQGTLRSIQEHQMPNEQLNAEGIRRKCPGFEPNLEEVGLFETAAGFLRPELCILASLERAKKFGAEIHFNETFLDFRLISNAQKQTTDLEHVVEVITSKARYTCNKLSLSLGPWAATLPQCSASSLGLSDALHIVRKVLFWFKVAREFEDRFRDMPVFIWDLGQLGNFYGFPGLSKKDRLFSKQINLNGKIEDLVDKEVEDENDDYMEVKVAFHTAPFSVLNRAANTEENHEKVLEAISGRIS
jgi:sarcosine oxidase